MLGSGLMALLLNFILFRILKLSHIEQYNRMGKPSLLFISSLKMFNSTGRFLFMREHKALGNNKLSMISDIIMVLIIFNFIGFISWFALIFYQAP